MKGELLIVLRRSHRTEKGCSIEALDSSWPRTYSIWIYTNLITVKRTRDFNKIHPKGLSKGCESLYGVPLGKCLNFSTVIQYRTNTIMGAFLFVLHTSVCNKRHCLRWEKTNILNDLTTLLDKIGNGKEVSLMGDCNGHW